MLATPLVRLGCAPLFERWFKPLVAYGLVGPY